MLQKPVMAAALTGFVLTLFGTAQADTPPVTDGLMYYYPFDGNANDAVSTNHGTVNGASLTADRNSNPNSAYNFTGADPSRIELANEGGSYPYPTGNFTLSAWINVDSFANSGNILDINASASDVPLRNAGISFRVTDTGTLYFRFVTTGDTSTEGQRIEGTSNLPTGEWRHVAAVRNASAGMSYVYIDGVEDGSAATLNDPIDYDADLYDDNSVNIGQFVRAVQNYTPVSFDGAIDEVGIFNRALTETEIGLLAGIPEPSTFTLAALGLLGVLAWGRRRRR